MRRDRCVAVSVAIISVAVRLWLMMHENDAADTVQSNISPHPNNPPIFSAN